jgi:hypothetical protein
MLLSKKPKIGLNAIIAVGAVAMMILFAAGLISSIWRLGQLQISQNELDTQFSETEPGRFAVENFSACKKAGGAFSSPASDAQCITQTVEGAENLKGSAFRSQVTREIVDWLDQSKKLQAH